MVSRIEFWHRCRDLNPSHVRLQGRLGLSQCLTPSGVQYVSNRGGPLVGEELLLLQGIPSR
jgi:hypothetical protein